MSTTALTIKNVLIEDKEYLTDLAVSLDISMAKVFSKVIAIAKTAEKTSEKTPEKTSKKTAQTEETDRKLYENETLIKELNEKVATAEAKVIDLLDMLETLKNQQPETIEKTVEVEIKLTGSQFICELEESIAYNARLIRKFAVKDGLVKGENYPNELANLAVKQLINREYPDHIDR